MGVIKEWRCLAHGPFDGVEAKCPHGCDAVIEREFRSAPAARSSGTKATDKALERLAASFGFSDLSNRNGSVAASQRGAQGGGVDLSPRWEAMPKGHVFHKGGQIEEREGAEGGAETRVGQFQHHTGRALGPSLGLPPEALATQTTPLPLGKLPPRPRPRVVGTDSVTSADFAQAVNSAQ